MKINIPILLLSFLALTACQEKKNKKATEQQEQFTQIDSLEKVLSEFANTKVLPGFSVSIFKADEIIFQKGFGLADIENNTPFQPDNIQIVASITKTLVGVALMKAVEDGLLGLDDDINEILPYQVINPSFPEEKITLRMLAAHTSSLSGTDKADKGYRFESPLLNTEFPEAYEPLLEYYNKTENITMPDYLERKLSTGGMWYDKKIFTQDKPGTSYEYSNIGITLLAHIIEIKTGVPFDKYTTDLLLKPLNMTSSYWALDAVPAKRHVVYYNELKNKVPKYYIISFPDGGLYSSISDMTKFLQEMMKGYEGKSNMLSQESFREMMRQQFTGEELNDGICWDLSFEGLIGHAGNDFGTATLMYFSPQNGIGRLLFTNITIETEAQENTFYGIFNTLFEYDFSN